METSVVIPVYNDPQGLEKTVTSLLKQNAGVEYEIIIADNGSTDETTEIARELARNEGVHLVIEDEIQSSYAARNLGVEKAQGDIIGFLDADMWVEPDYIESITRVMTENDRAYMGCEVEIIADDDVVSRYNRETDFPIELFVNRHAFAPTCCLVVHHQIFDAVGEFDERLVSSGDLEFGQRVNDAGFEEVYEPGITVYHPARSTVGKLVSKSFRIGKGKQQLMRYYGDRFNFRSPLNPRGYLPVNPLGFRNSLGRKTRSKNESVLWYWISYLEKLSETIGKLYERYLG